MKFLILALLFFSCAGSDKISKPKDNESFYSGSYKEGEKILITMNWKLVKVDTVKQKGKRDIYLFHYKN